jgi:hypothetical protein
MGSMQYIEDRTILPCITIPYELLSRLIQRINAAFGGDKINSLLKIDSLSTYSVVHFYSTLDIQPPRPPGPAAF